MNTNLQTLPRVLNPGLFAALNHVLGVIRVKKPLQANRWEDRFDWSRGSPQQLRRLVSYGEGYWCRCPYCNDQSGHLDVNYEYSVSDNRIWLATCFRDGCLKDEQRRRHLANRIRYAFSGQWNAPAQLPPPQPPPAPTLPALPADFRLLTELDRIHPAVQYVRHRGFDPAELASNWGVGFCNHSGDVTPPICHRLFIPYLAKIPAPTVDVAPTLAFIGWQARAVFEGVHPRYMTMTGFQKSTSLYGHCYLHHLAPHWPAIVVEGVTDAWRVGAGAVALLGKTASQEQIRQLRLIAQQRPVIVMLDRDAENEARELAIAISNSYANYPVVAVPPPGVFPDPGSTPRDLLVDQVRRAIEA